MSEKTFKEEAEKLANLEIYAKIIYCEEQQLTKGLSNCKGGLFSKDRALKKDLEVRLEEKRKKLNDLSEQIRTQNQRLNEMRCSIPEIRSNQYWFDIPFSAESVNSDDPDKFAFPGGFYIESGRLDIQIKNRNNYIQKNPGYQPAILVSDTYEAFNDQYIILYLNKEHLRTNTSKQAEIKLIYNVFFVSGNYDVISYIDHSQNSVRSIAEEYENEATRKNADLNENIAEFREFVDNLERFCHRSFFTNKERWMMGRMSNEDYYDESLWRDYAEIDKEAKVREELERKRFLAERAQKEAMTRFVRSKRGKKEGGDILRIMPVAEVVYCAGELVAIVTYTQPQKVTEFKCDDNMDITNLEGKVYNLTTLFKKAPDPAPLLNHIVQFYGDYLPLYSVLESRPTNCPDNLWRMWAELRWMKVLEQFSDCNE